MRSRYTIAIDDTRPFSMVVDELVALGFAPEKQLSDLGIVTGTSEAGLAPHLRRVAGVLTIEVEGQMGVAPPDSDVQ